MNMDFKSQLYELLRSMVALESQGECNWAIVNEIGSEALCLISENDTGEEIDSYVIKYLDDADIRERDYNYGQYQRKKIIDIINSNKK